MGKFKQKPHSKRFIELYQILLKDGKFKNQTDFIQQLCKDQQKKYSVASFSQALLGHRDIPTHLINLMQKVFNGNRDYIFDNKEPKFIDPTTQEQKEKSEIEFLRDLVKSQQLVIENLSKGKK